jgi:PAS domain S-box-containing protein
MRPPLTTEANRSFIGGTIAQDDRGNGLDGPEHHATEGLELLDVGVAVFGQDSRLVFANQAFRALRHYPDNLCREGVTLEALLRFNAERGDFGPGDVNAQVTERLAEINEAEKRELEREMADGQILGIKYRRTESGGLVITFEDRTAERRAEAALKASEERYALISDAAEEAIYEWNIAEGRFFASPRLAALVGRDATDDGIRNWGWDEIVHPDELKHYQSTVAAHLSGEQPRWSCEYRLKDASGGWRWVSDHGTSIRDENGKAIRMIAAIRDITDRVEKDAALAASEERHTLVSQATSDGIYDWNVAEDLLYVSDTLTRLLDFDFGLTASGMWAERVHEDDYDQYVGAIRAHFRGETDALDCEYRVRGADGGYRYIQDRGIGVRGKDGKVTRMVGAVRDVTEIREAKAEIERTEARLMSSLATISDGILLVDAGNRVQLWNDRYYEIFTEAAGGVDLSKVIARDRPFFDMIRDGYNLGMFKPHPDGVDAWMTARIKAWEQPAAEWELELANGTWILLNERMMPDGGRVSVYTDISEFKRRESEAEAARQRFEDAIEAISSGFALFDADDRLVVWNARFQQYFSEMADVFKPGVPFREIITASTERGLFPAAGDDPEGFIDNLMERRAEGVGQVRENLLENGMWLQITDHRTKDGGLVSIYTDVTGLKTSEQESQAARQRFEEAIEAISSGFSLWDADDRLVICNSRYRELYADLSDAVRPGVTLREVLSLAAKRDLIPAAKNDPEAYIEANIRKRAEGVGQLREHRLANGLWLQITDHRTADGGIVSIHTDVTELKTREAEIRKQSAILEATMENMGQGISMVDNDLNTVAFNKKFLEMFEFPEDQFGRGFSMEQAFRFNAERGEYGPGDIEEQVRERMELSRKFLAHRFERTRPDGVTVEIVGNPVEGGGFVSTYTDITERKRADDALKAALEEFNAVLDSIDYGVLFMGPDLRARIINRAFGEIWGIQQAFIDQRPTMRELIEYNRDTGVYDVAPEDWDDWLDNRVEQIRKGDIPPGEFQRADGKVLSYQCVALPDGGRMLTYFDITELKQAEQVARDSEVRLRGILENSPIGVAVIGDDDIIHFHNSRFAEILRGPGRNLVGESSEQFRTDHLAVENWQRRFSEDGSVTKREMRYRALDGSEIWSQSTYERAQWEGKSSRLTWIYDITEEKANREALVVARDDAEAALADLTKAQERLVQAEKMASLGQLTAGIAHEIKNPLNFVNNFAKLSDELLGRRGPAPDRPREPGQDQRTRQAGRFNRQEHAAAFARGAERAPDRQPQFHRRRGAEPGLSRSPGREPEFQHRDGQDVVRGCRRGRMLPAGSDAGVPEPDQQWHVCGQQAWRRGRRGFRPDNLADHPGQGRQDRDRSPRQRRRHRGGGARKTLRSLLHHQAGR